MDDVVDVGGDEVLLNSAKTLVLLTTEVRLRGKHTHAHAHMILTGYDSSKCPNLIWKCAFDVFYDFDAIGSHWPACVWGSSSPGFTRPFHSSFHYVEVNYSYCLFNILFTCAIYGHWRLFFSFWKLVSTVTRGALTVLKQATSEKRRVKWSEGDEFKLVLSLRRLWHLYSLQVLVDCL